MKKRIGIGIGLSLLAFVIGVAGMYAVMPYVAPDRVEVTQKRLDSLVQIETARADSLAQVEASRAGGLAADSHTLALQDSLQPGSLATSMNDSMITLAEARMIHIPRLDTLADSLSVLHTRLARQTREASKLQTRIDELEAEMEASEARRKQTLDMANTLAKIEDRELQAILEKLDVDVLERLYFEATGRNRQRLLQSMPSNRAASFVDRLVSDGAPSEHTPATVPASTGTN